MNIVRSGHLYVANVPGTLRYTAAGGVYWSSRGDANTTAYFLALYSALNASDYNSRYLGFPLRCLSTVLGM